MTQELLTSLAAGCFLSFGWAVRPGRSLAVTVLGLLTAAIHLPAIWVGASWLGGWAAVPLVASWALFWSAMEAQARQKISGQDFPIDGPYRWIRHPLYLSYILAWLSSPVASGSPVLFVSAGIWTVFYVVAARREERESLAGPHSEDYEAYRQRTGMFVPHIVVVRPGTSEDKEPRCVVPDLSTYQIPIVN